MRGPYIFERHLLSLREFEVLRTARFRMLGGE